MGTVLKCGITSLELFLLFLCHFGMHSEKLEEKHSCFSGIPDTILCNDTERISIYDLQYARNCSRCHCYGSSSICGQFTLPGSWVNSYYYNTVSGTQGSQFTTKRIPCPNSGTERIYTNQVHLRYECVPAKKIIDFCAMSMQTEGESVYLQYTTENRPKKRDCHCYGSTTLGDLQIHAVDIRFPMDSTGTCDINQKSYLQFDSGKKSIKCNDKQLIGGYTSIYNTSNQNIDILLHLDGEPQSVWIGISATTGTKVNVSCENTPPTEVFSTETIISTEKTTFDVATSKPVKTSTNPEKTKKPPYTTDVERTTKVKKTPLLDLTTTDETRLTSAQSTEHLSTISVNHVSQKMLPVKKTKASMSTEKPTFGVTTSKPVKSPMNTEKTKGPLETTDLERTTKAMKTSLIDHQATTVETRLTSARSPEQLSTISVNPQKTLPDKTTTDQPIDPAIIVLALTSFLTLVLVVIGFVIGRSRYVKSRLHRKHCNANQEKIQLDTNETGVNLEQNLHRMYKDDTI